MYDSTKDTMLHKKNIEDVMLNFIIPELIKRAEDHDNSKLQYPEKECYDKYIPQLRLAKYGTSEYMKIRLAMKKKGLDHHFAENRHHPEYFGNDISKMNLFDLIEMFADHYASSLVSDTKYDIGEMKNSKNYHYDKQILQIFLNTYNEYLKDREKQ